MTKQKARLRNSFDDEESILDCFWNDYEPSECCLFSDHQASLELIAETVTNPDGWENHSGKNDEPPDFVNPSKKLMMEVMCVDDHERLGDNGKSIINPSRAHESKLIKDYNSELCGLVSSFTSNPYPLTVIGQTNLPTFEDHNYQNYLDSFAKIIDKYGAKSDFYRKNYSGYKLVFFIMDGSCTYA